MFGTITAFIIERFEFKGKNIVVALFFMGMLIPTFVTEIARFQIIQGLHLYNTIWAPIVIYVAFGSDAVVYLQTIYFRAFCGA